MLYKINSRKILFLILQYKIKCVIYLLSAAIPWRGVMVTPQKKLKVDTNTGLVRLASAIRTRGI